MQENRPNMRFLRTFRWTRTAYRNAALTVAMLATALLSACAPSTISHDVSRYRPDVPAHVRTPWVWSAKFANPTGAADTHRPVNADSTAIPVDSSGTTEVARPAAPDKRDDFRRLRPGDTVSISIMSTTDSISYHEQIDDDGKVKIKYLGDVLLNDRTTSEAEQLIEKLYVERQIFRGNVDVVIMAQQVTYFIRGEVKSPGQYPLSGEKTLLQAIAEAGGYTEFKDEKKIQINRSDKTLTFNAKKIGAGEQDDPLVKDGDIIVVNRSIWGL